ncbi:MAG: hypothetical protein IT427_12765 [Pirellulales bacterium]|nr:hypothetical protein [Pirellulales bacterium]
MVNAQGEAESANGGQLLPESRGDETILVPSQQNPLPFQFLLQVCRKISIFRMEAGTESPKRSLFR